MKLKTVITLIAFITFSVSCIFSTFKKSGKEKIKFIVPKGWPKPVYDFDKNPITENGFQLGRKLFYDPLLSRDSTISCSSCHLQYTNFTHIDHQLSHGIEGRKGNRNTSSLVNLAWNSSFMWDGGVNHIEVQPIAPLENAAEMDASMKTVLEKLNHSGFYRNEFKKVFGKDEITGQHLLKAISQYMLLLESYNSKYDKVMRQEAEFTPYEAKGLVLFRKHCESCHSEPLFTNNGFENNGLEVDPYLKDIGRMKITGKREDSLTFKVPSLRNVEVSYPYMHDGRFRNLEMVIFHYTSGIESSKNPSDKIKQAIALEEEDKRNLIAFLKTLTDENFLRDPRFSYPR